MQTSTRTPTEATKAREYSKTGVGASHLAAGGAVDGAGAGAGAGGVGAGETAPAAGGFGFG